jgi:hypothetical protein
MSEHELTAHIYDLETKLEEVSKDRDDWARKYQELSKKNEVTYAQHDKLVAEFAHLKSFVQGDLQEYDTASLQCASTVSL